jgi:hypothetical protein
LENPTFRRNIASIFRVEERDKQETKRSRRDAMLGLLFNPEDVSDIFIRNVEISPNYTVQL